MHTAPHAKQSSLCNGVLCGLCWVEHVLLGHGGGREESRSVEGASDKNGLVCVVEPSVAHPRPLYCLVALVPGPIPLAPPHHLNMYIPCFRPRSPRATRVAPGCLHQMYCPAVPAVEQRTREPSPQPQPQPPPPSPCPHHHAWNTMVGAPHIKIGSVHAMDFNRHASSCTTYPKRGCHHMQRICAMCVVDWPPHAACCLPLPRPSTPERRAQ